MSAEPAAATIDLIEPRLRRALDSCSHRPFVMGLCGAQGSGKSTVAEGLRARLEATGVRVALLSIDDIYLPREDRERLAMTVHPLLRTRGVPGTHDTALGEAVMEACGRQGSVALPRFAKEWDTRRPQAEWPRIDTPVEMLLLEGWCVGAVAQPDTDLVSPVNTLEREEDADGRWRRWVNARLAEDYRRLFGRIDWLVLLAAPGFDVVGRWRRQQEHALRASLAAEGRGQEATLDDDAVERFIRYYQRITEHILREMPGRADCTVRLDAERRPITLLPGPPG